MRRVIELQQTDNDSTMFSEITVTTRAKDVLPNINCMQGPFDNAMHAADGTIPLLPGGRRAQKPVFVPGDLDIETRPSEGPNTSSLWIWRKSVQRFQRYLMIKHKKMKKSQTALKTEPYLRAVIAITDKNYNYGNN